VSNFAADRPLRLDKAVKNAVANANCLPGTPLPNSAVILKQKPSAYSSSQHRIFTVLAVHRGYQPFVVWTRVIGVRDNANNTSEGNEFTPIDYCIDGRYFVNLDEAYQVFMGAS
jgi:hypothetical protein